MPCTAYCSKVSSPLMFCNSIVRCNHPGPESVPERGQVLQAVHSEHAQDRWQCPDGEHLQAEESQGLVALLRQEGKRRNGTNREYRASS